MNKLGDNIFSAANTVCQTDLNTNKQRVKMYNSYVLRGEKSALIGGAADSVTDEVIKSADFAIFNRSFPALGIERILSVNPGIEIVGTAAALKNLKELTNKTFTEHLAKDGAELDLGGITLRFLITPNLNWPDTMMTYDMTNNTLFSGLAFGSYSGEDLREFYDAELSRFKPFVMTAMERLRALEINMICPDIGDVLTGSSAVGSYKSWSAPRSQAAKTAAVFYASQSGNTLLMAKSVEKVMLNSGVSVRSFDASKLSRDEMLDTLYSADILAFGSPTIHRSAVTPIWEIVSAIDLVNMKRRPCMVFGSYGWGGEGIQYIHNFLKLLRLSPFEKPFGCLMKPSAEDLSELEKYTKRFLESANEI